LPEQEGVVPYDVLVGLLVHVELKLVEEVPEVLSQKQI
jgi:hypothetical protein